MLTRLFVARVPGLFIGPSGYGKTAMIEGFARRIGVPARHFDLSATDPAIIGGIPYPKTGDDEGMVFSILVPEWAKDVSGKDGLLLLDEINVSSSRVTEGAVLELVNGSRIGNYRIEGLRVFAACNPPEWGLGRPLSKPLVRRFCIVRWDADKIIEGWINYMEGGAGILDNIPPKEVIFKACQRADELYPHCAAMVAQWAKGPGMVAEWEKLQANAGPGEQFPCPANGTACARIAAAILALQELGYKTDEDVMRSLFVGKMGSIGAGLVEVMDGFDPLALAKLDPKDWADAWPTRPDRFLCTLRIAAQEADPKSMDGFWMGVAGLWEAGFPKEIIIAGMKPAVEKNPRMPKDFAQKIRDLLG